MNTYFLSLHETSLGRPDRATLSNSAKRSVNNVSSELSDDAESVIIIIYSNSCMLSIGIS